MATLNFLRWQITPPHPPSLMAYLTPPSPPHFFFHQNDHKGCTLDFLDGLGHFLFWFWGDREKILMWVVTTPLERMRVKLKCYIDMIDDSTLLSTPKTPTHPADKCISSGNYLSSNIRQTKSLDISKGQQETHLCN